MFAASAQQLAGIRYLDLQRGCPMTSPIGSQRVAARLRRLLLLSCSAAALAATFAGGALAAGTPKGLTTLPVPSSLIREPWTVAISPSGSTLYVTSFENGTIVAVPVNKPSAASNFLGGLNDPAGLAANPSGADLYFGEDIDSSDVQAAPLTGGTSPLNVPSGFIDGLSVAPDGDTLVVSEDLGDSETEGLVIYDLSNGTVVGNAADPQQLVDWSKVEPFQSAYSRDGKHLYIATSDGLVVASVSGSSDQTVTLTKVISAASPGSTGDGGVAVSPDGDTVYVSVAGLVTQVTGTKVLAVDAATGAIVNTFSGFDQPTGLAIAPNGQNLYVTNGNDGKLLDLPLAALTGAPSVSGQAHVGSTLHARVNTSTVGTAKVKLSYQWLANGKSIKHAKASTLKLTAALRHKRISVKISGTAPGLTAMSDTSRATTKVS